MSKFKNWIKNPTNSISIIALIVSGLTWLATRQQTQLAAGQIRAYVQVIEVKLDEPITDATFIKLKLKIKNFGQTAAVNVYGEMDYRVGMPDPKGEGNKATGRRIGSMGPGMERTVTFTSNRYNRYDWPTPQLRNYQTVYFFGTIWFTDYTTHARSKEDWCYALDLKTGTDLKKTDLEPCDILTYESKENR
jgi:hypothetical protein